MSGLMQQTYRSPQGYRQATSVSDGQTPPAVSPRKKADLSRGAMQQQYRSERKGSLNACVMEEEKRSSKGKQTESGKVWGNKSVKKYNKPAVTPASLHDFLRSFVLSKELQSSGGNVCCKGDLPSTDVSLENCCGEGSLRSPKDSPAMTTSSETVFKRLTPSELFNSVSPGRRHNYEEGHRSPANAEVVSHYNNSLVHTCSEECGRQQQPQTPASPISLQGVTKQDLLNAYFELLLKQKKQSEMSVQYSRSEERRHTTTPVKNDLSSSPSHPTVSPSLRLSGDVRRCDLNNKLKAEPPEREVEAESSRGVSDPSGVVDSRFPLDSLKVDVAKVASTSISPTVVLPTLNPAVLDTQNLLVYQNKMTSESSRLQIPSLLLSGGVSPSANPVPNPMNPTPAAFFRPVSDLRLQPRFQHNGQPVLLPAAIPGNHPHQLGGRFLVVSPQGGFQMFQTPQPQFLIHNPQMGGHFVPAMYPFIMTNPIHQQPQGHPMHNPYQQPYMGGVNNTPMSAYGASIQTTRNLNGTKMVDVILPSHPGVLAELTIFKTETVTATLHENANDKQSLKDELSVSGDVLRSFCDTPSERSEAESLEDAASSINDSVETLGITRIPSKPSSLGISDRDCSSSAVSPCAVSSNISIEDEHSPDDCACSDSGYMSESNSVVGIPPAMRFQSPPPLREFCLGHPWDDLSQQIWRHYIDHRQCDDLYHRKLRLKELMHNILSKDYPECGLFIIGSSLTGFGSSSSDMDVCLMLSRDVDQRFHAAQILDHVGSIFKEQQDMIGDAQLIHAKVPILRLRFNDPMFSDIRVDLNTNNPVSIKNTHMMFYYATWDWRVKPLVLVVKQWAQCWDINDASRSTLSSYSLVLMVLHYLQCGTPGSPVLPSLQKLYPEKFSSKNDIKDLNVNEILDPPASVMFFSSNFSSLADLFLGFLEYFAHRFNFDDDVICIRNGSKLSRSNVARADLPFSFLSQWRSICIEEPFNHSNTARAIYDEGRFQHVRNAFTHSYKLLAKSNSLTILFQQGVKNTNANINPLRSQYVAQK